MTKFEYKIEIINISSEINYNDFLNKLGLEGWELCSIISLPNFSNILYFKRQISFENEM